MFWLLVLVHLCQLVPYDLVNDNIVFDLYNMAVTSYMAVSTELLDAMSFIASSPSLQVNVLLDSGSSHHIIWDRSMFSSYQYFTLHPLVRKDSEDSPSSPRSPRTVLRVRRQSEDSPRTVRCSFLNKKNHCLVRA